MVATLEVVREREGKGSLFPLCTSEPLFPWLGAERSHRRLAPTPPRAQAEPWAPPLCRRGRFCERARPLLAAGRRRSLGTVYKGSVARKTWPSAECGVRRESTELPEVSERLTMAGPQQQPPYLHLAELTASQFLEIWKHFDADGQ